MTAATVASQFVPGAGLVDAPKSFASGWENIKRGEYAKGGVDYAVGAFDAASDMFPLTAAIPPIGAAMRKGNDLVEQTEKAIPGIKAYHASPHDFDKFRWGDDVRGKGEGAQAYGDGLYSAESDRTMEDYYQKFDNQMNMESPIFIAGREAKSIDDVDTMMEEGVFGEELLHAQRRKQFLEKLSEEENELFRKEKIGEISQDDLWKEMVKYNNIKKQTKTEEVFAEDFAHDLVKEYTTSIFRRWGEFTEPKDFIDTKKDFLLGTKDDFIENKYPIEKYIEGFRIAEEALLKTNPSPAKIKKPVRYEIQIAVDKNELLDLDKPYKEQSPKVQEAFKDIALKLYKENKHGHSSQKLGAIVHSIDQYGDKSPVGDISGRRLYDYLAKGAGGPREASNALKEAGVPGSKFLDGFSRKKSEGTHNFVIFDPELIKIVRKYGVAALVAGGLLSKEIGDIIKEQGIDKGEENEG